MTTEGALLAAQTLPLLPQQEVGADEALGGTGEGVRHQFVRGAPTTNGVVAASFEGGDDGLVGLGRGRHGGRRRCRDR